jgi:hypothetical protein
MRYPHARWAIIATTFFLLEVNDMSNHANTFESNQAPRPKVGHPPLQGRAIRNGRSRATKPHRQNRACSSNPAEQPTR